MQTQTLERTSHDSTRRPRRLLPALAAVVAVIVAVVAVVFANGADEEAAQEARSAVALATVQEFYAAINSGDVTTAQRLTEADEPDGKMWAFNAITAAAHPREVVGCAVTDASNSLYVEVGCTLTETYPVFVTSGVTQVVEVWQAFDDGPLQWLPTTTPGFAEAVRDTREYLRAEHPEEYADVCDPSRYAFGSVNFNEGIALTPECAELIVPLSEDIADWVRAGKP